MAENKYEMLIRPRRVDSNFKIKPQPWYRERLNAKYESKPSLIASSWTFIKDGIDDFRNGVIPKLDSSIVIKGNKGVRPSIYGSEERDTASAKSVKKQLEKNDAVYNKSLPSQRQKLKRVEVVEKELLGHPLALYPHIEDSVPPDLFEEIVDLLDPSMALSTEFLEDIEEVSSSRKTDFDLSSKIEEEDNIEQSISSYAAAFKKLPKVTNQGEEDTCKEDRNCRKKGKQRQLTEIENVTKEFCDWVRDLGGESNNIEENTIKNLFASGYDTKPTLSVPVHVVELTSVPPELRADYGAVTADEEKLRKIKHKKSSYTPSWVKVKYGAWYLDPKTWKVREGNKPLEDPQEIEEKQMSEAKKKGKSLDKTLASLHGARAFRDFIEKKNVRQPEFLEGVTVVGEKVSENVTNSTKRKENETKK